jgi:hypothetical protein
MPPKTALPKRMLVQDRPTATRLATRLSGSGGEHVSAVCVANRQVARSISSASSDGRLGR